MLNVGKLYQVKQYFWLFFPSKDIADAHRRHLGVVEGRPLVVAPAATAAATAVWSKHYNCNITHISENSMFCLLEQDGKLLKVLSTNGEIGWILYPESEEWTKGSFEEVSQ